MQSKATTIKDYLNELPADRKTALIQLRKEIKKNIPKGFQESISYGMIGYVVPHSIYPKGYHCNPKLPLPFMGFASQKHFVAVYSIAVYMMPELLNWFTKEFAKQVSGKLDMGKSCIRFKKMDQIPFKLIGELAGKVSTKEFIALYEKNMKR
ncbi:MAG: DUF1801 domain-containing protein [Chitinophagaceae bacterium]|nr:MAG: DUF1801 domain-containing protein [Chitinophagaceae bacterium]